MPVPYRIGKGGIYYKVRLLFIRLPVIGPRAVLAEIMFV